MVIFLLVNLVFWWWRLVDRKSCWTAIISRWLARHSLTTFHREGAREGQFLFLNIKKMPSNLVQELSSGGIRSIFKYVSPSEYLNIIHNSWAHGRDQGFKSTLHSLWVDCSLLQVHNYTRKVFLLQ